MLRRDALDIRCKERDERREVVCSQRTFGNQSELLRCIEI
jgi:hypothetical protein